MNSLLKVILFTLFLNLAGSSVGFSAVSCKAIFSSAKSQNPQIDLLNLQRGNKEDQKKAEKLKKFLLHELERGEIEEEEDLYSTTGMYRIKFKSGIEAMWKREGRESPEAEMATARIVEHLGWDVMALTTLRDINGKRGVIQLRILNVNKEPLSDYPISLYMLDFLIANWDRHGENYLLSEGHIFAIDHGHAFEWRHEFELSDLKDQFYGSDPKYSKKEIIRRFQEFTVSKSVYKRLKNTTDKKWSELLGRYLDKSQIRAFLKRRDTILTVVEAAREKWGDVIFNEE